MTIRAAPGAGAGQDGALADRPPEKAARPDAEFEITSRNPDPLPAGYAVTCPPTTSGLTETIVVTGGQGTTVTVGGIRAAST